MANAILLSSADAVVATVPAVEGNVNVISDTITWKYADEQGI